MNYVKICRIVLISPQKCVIMYDGWMKNKRSAMISCNDGFRPVSFYIEALDEEADV